MIKKPVAKYRFKWALQNKDGHFYSKNGGWTEDINNASVHNCQQSTIQKILSNETDAVRAVEVDIRGSVIRIAMSPQIVNKKK